MKKATFGIVLVAIMFATSCKKNNLSPNSWTFKGVNYPVVTCGVVLGVGVLEGIGNNGTVNVVFNNNPPTTPGTYTYTVASGGISSNNNFVGITTTVGNNNTQYYSSTGGNGTNQTITLTLSSSGKYTATGSGIVLSNDSNPADSGSLSLNITNTF